MEQLRKEIAENIRGFGFHSSLDYSEVVGDQTIGRLTNQIISKFEDWLIKNKMGKMEFRCDHKVGKNCKFTDRCYKISHPPCCSECAELLKCKEQLSYCISTEDRVFQPYKRSK